MEHDRRLSPRFPFIASAEVLSEIVGTSTTARISDLSATGCYVDTINPLPHGTFVKVKIFTESQHFEAPATVVYVHTRLLTWDWSFATSRLVLKPYCKIGFPQESRA